MDLNIQLCPTPVFYIGEKIAGRRIADTTGTSVSGAIVSGVVAGFLGRSIADAANSAGAIVGGIVTAIVDESVSDASNINCSIISGNAMNSHTVALTEAQPQVWAFNHNLSPRPAFIRAVLLCTTADSSGAQVGEEYDIWSFYDYTYGTMPFGLYCTAVDIILSYTGTGGVNINYVRAGGIVQNVGDFTHFSIKVYWQ